MDTYLDKLTQSIEQHVAALPLPSTPQGLYAPIAYIMEDGGKRMRPMLTLLACGMFGEDPMRAMPSALALEVFHNFTLLHDDIMDRASKRRGRQTVHVRWDDNTAILSGDAMMIFSYTLLAQSANFQSVFPVFSRSSIEVCEGQQMDMEFEKRDEVKMSEYLEMIRLKTASLMASALVVGAIEGGATAREQADVYRFGEFMGLAFQIQDDLLDTYGDAATFGKAIGGDIAEGKQTFLRITALSLALGQDREILRTSRSYDQVKAIYDRLNVREITQNEIEHHYSMAMDVLSHFDPLRSEYLKQYAQIILKRNK